MNVGVPDLSEKVIRRKTYLEHSKFEILKNKPHHFQLPQMWYNGQKQNRIIHTPQIQQKLPKVSSIGGYNEKPKYHNSSLTYSIVLYFSCFLFYYIFL